MMRAALLSCAALAGLIAAGSSAQEREDAARLDDFALPQAEPALPVEQLANPRDDTVPAPPQAIDRTLARPAQTDAAGAMPTQLAVTGAGGIVDQLPSTRGSRLAAGTAVSGTKDSAPGALVRIVGKDKCDPQLAQRFYAECLRILELRSAEFSAPRPPELSAEQNLLIEQRQREAGYADESPTLRLRYATATQPDADLQSNQEIASIYLRDLNSAPDGPPAPEPLDPKLGEILNGLGIQTTPPPSGP